MTMYEFTIHDAYSHHQILDRRWLGHVPKISDVIVVNQLPMMIVEVCEEHMYLRVLYGPTAADRLRSDFYGERNRCRFHASALARLRTEVY